MLSYLHSFHAGNFADVHKHAVLHLVLDHLTRKKSPLAMIDLYAGAGCYSLNSSEARKTAEAEQGVRRLWPSSSWPPVISSYTHCLTSNNRGINETRATDQNELNVYPGSPMQLLARARDTDSLVFNELHPREHESLETLFGRDSRVSIHKRDAIEAMAALLPPTEKRGVVLIDPSYELKDDYQKLQQAVIKTTRRWRHGVYLLWYPLLPANAHRPMVEGIQRVVDTETLVSELRVPVNGPGMHGSGMLVINPTWQLGEKLDGLAPWFARLSESGAVIKNRTTEATKHE